MDDEAHRRHDDERPSDGRPPRVQVKTAWNRKDHGRPDNRAMEAEAVDARMPSVIGILRGSPSHTTVAAVRTAVKTPPDRAAPQRDVAGAARNLPVAR